MASEIMTAPVFTDTREITAKDILYTAWGRGRAGKCWMEETEPLAKTMDALVSQTVAIKVENSVRGFASAGIVPVDSLPTKEGSRADLWIKRYGDSKPYRVCDCSLHHTQYQNGQPVDELTWSSGMGDTFRRYLPEEIVGWSLTPKWKELSHG